MTGWQKVHAHIDGLPDVAAGHVWVADIPRGLGRILKLYKGNARLNRARAKGFTPATHPTSAIRMDGSQTDTLVENNAIVNVSVAGITPKEVNTM